MDYYESYCRIGNCRICKKEQDLRMGVCFSCSDLVDGEKLSDNEHYLFERDNPDNSWIIKIS